MSIRPVDFNGMIQNTHEVSQAKANEDNKANLQQQNVQVAVMHEEQNASSMVQQMEKSQQHEYNYEDGGAMAEAMMPRGEREPERKNTWIAMVSCASRRDSLRLISRYKEHRK